MTAESPAQDMPTQPTSEPRAPSQRALVVGGIKREWNEDTRQFLAVLLVAAVALLLGYAVREYATSQTRTVSAGNVSAEIPAAWVVQGGTQDLLFTAADPRTPGQRYAVTRPSGLGSDPDAVANATVAGKSQVLTDFQVLDRDTATVNGAAVPQVTYTYVTTRNGQVPQVIEGRDLYVPASGGVLVVTLESPSHNFQAALDDFERFAASVRG